MRKKQRNTKYAKQITRGAGHLALILGLGSLLPAATKAEEMPLNMAFIQQDESLVAGVIDNDKIQTLRGVSGIWKQFSTSQELSYFLQTVGADWQLLLKLNDAPDGNLNNLSDNQWIFIPYGKSYLEQINKNPEARQIPYASRPKEYIWPVSGQMITSHMGNRWGGMHPGVDVACEMGSVIIAARDGKVVQSDFMGPLGNVVIIEHEDKMQSVYAHNTFTLLKQGEMVKKGQIIAFSGTTGWSSGPHLHFEIRFTSIVLDPEHFLPIYDDMKKFELTMRTEWKGVAKQRN